MYIDALNHLERVEKNKWKLPGKEAIKTIIGLIDYTTLNDTDTQASVRKWQQDSIDLMREHNLLCGGWCTFSEFTAQIAKNGEGLDIALAAVAGNFPSGKASTFIKIQEAIEAEVQGADEVDLVLNKGDVAEGNWKAVEQEVRAVKTALKRAHLKVIMETGLLSPEQIEQVSNASIRGGADFIKTSTGKTNKGATLEAVAIMCYSIQEHFNSSGVRIGIKPSGGISTPQEAFKYVQLVEDILGKAWIRPELFRIGASRLLSNAIQAWEEQSK
jgi:deoxyribose-phosphate aldolase